MSRRKKHATTRPTSRRATTQSKISSGNAAKQEKHTSPQLALDDREGWKKYWKERRQPWRTEPEINQKRQEELAQCKAIVPDIEQGIYPFKGMNLNRADVEWLLATYKDSFTAEKGLDIRGADLSREDLSGLPLRGLNGGLSIYESEYGLNGPVVQMNGCKLVRAQLTNAQLRKAQLQEADFREAVLVGADLTSANLKGADLTSAKLERAYFNSADLERAKLFWTELQDVSFSSANLEGADLGAANLKDLSLNEANLQHADLSLAKLKGTDLTGAMLGGADLYGASLEEVDLYGTKFADRQGVGPLLTDVTFDSVNLAVVDDWSSVKVLGDEKQHLWEALRANRQLAVALQSQGLHEEAAHFAYRANMLQRKVLWLQMLQQNISFRQRLRKFGSWFFSGFLDLLAGYGYRPGRTLGWYLLIITLFTVGYALVTHLLHAQPYPLAWYEALILSVSAFHGRGFFQPVQSLGDPVAILAAIEAVVGLLIEISFIATFTQRFFGK